MWSPAVAEERAEIRQQPETELAELAAYYEEKGLSPGLAREVAKELMRRSPLKAKLESDHGIVEVMSRLDVARASLASAAAYALGAAIPLSITVAVPVRLEAGVILAAVAASLTVTSIIGQGPATSMSRRRSCAPSPSVSAPSASAISPAGSSSERRKGAYGRPTA